MPHTRASLRSRALATTVPFFVLMFSATYFLTSPANTDNFNAHGLTRIDSLYFTVTVFATVGFGDISPASQTARLGKPLKQQGGAIVDAAIIRVDEEGKGEGLRP